jgi:hypothetical protein
MAWTQQTAGTVRTANLSLAVTAGDLIVIAHAFDDNSSTPTISDGVNTWTRIGSVQRSSGADLVDATWWWAIAATTATLAIAIAATAATYDTFGATYRNGTLPANPLSGSAQQYETPGVTGANNDTSTNLSVAPVLGDLVLAIIVDTGSTGTNIFSAGTGYTLVAAAGKQNGSADTHAWEHDLNSAAGARAGTFTATVTDNVIVMAAKFTPPAGGPTAPFSGGRTIYKLAPQRWG